MVRVVMDGGGGEDTQLVSFQLVAINTRYFNLIDQLSYCTPFFYFFYFFPFSFCRSASSGPGYSILIILHQAVASAKHCLRRHVE